MKKINVIFDFDSTLVTIEGIDELAKFKGVGERVAEMTTAAMAGSVDFETVFQERLEIIRPTTSDLEKLADLYAQNLTSGVAELVPQLQKRANLFVVSGGYKAAMLKTTRQLGLADNHIFANELIFDRAGNFLGLDATSRLGKNQGKAEVITQIRQNFPGHTVLIGDGHSDLEAAGCVNEFICFAGVVNREQVAKNASSTIYELAKLKTLY